MAPAYNAGTKKRARPQESYLKRTKGFFLTKRKLPHPPREAANRADRYAKRDRPPSRKREYTKHIGLQRVGSSRTNNG